MLPHRSINPGQMTRFNHYALGAVADCLRVSVGGISPGEEGGWQVFLVRPVLGSNITSARVSYDGPYGQIACTWRLERGKFKMQLIVPPNSSAELLLPSGHIIDGSEKSNEEI
jgi:alpha-L-rhamnosidase